MYADYRLPSISIFSKPLIIGGAILAVSCATFPYSVTLGTAVIAAGAITTLVALSIFRFMEQQRAKAAREVLGRDTKIFKENSEITKLVREILALEPSASGACELKDHPDLQEELDEAFERHGAKVMDKAKDLTWEILTRQHPDFVTVFHGMEIPPLERIDYLLRTDPRDLDRKSQDEFIKECFSQLEDLKTHRHEVECQKYCKKFITIIEWSMKRREFADEIQEAYTAYQAKKDAENNKN